MMDNTAIIALCFTNGADINAKDQLWRNTAALGCHERGHAEVVALLLKNGADINAENKYGNTPLHVAARMEKLKS